MHLFFHACGQTRLRLIVIEPSTTFTKNNACSGIFLLKGIAHEALDNRDRAAECYRAALLNDVYCYEAFDRLTTHSMLTEDEEHKLFNSLRFPESGDDGFLVRYLYSSKVKRALPDEQPAMNRTLAGWFYVNSFNVFVRVSW